MLMPKTPMNKNDCLVFCQHNIGFSWQILAMNPEAEAKSMQKRTHKQLRFSVN
jgi:hypothetical protein